MANLIHKDEVYAIIGAAMAVYNELGPGFLEAIYQEALEIEFTERNIPFQSQAELPVFYKSLRLKKFYITDFLVFNKVIVELKAISQLSSSDEAQLINQLKASCHDVGVLINFGAKDNLEWKRKIYTRHKSIKKHQSA